MQPDPRKAYEDWRAHYLFLHDLREDAKAHGMDAAAAAYDAQMRQHKTKLVGWEKQL